MVAVLGEGVGGHRRGGGATVVTDAQDEPYIRVDVANDDDGKNRSLHIRFRPDHQRKESDTKSNYETILKKWIDSVKPDVSQPQVITPTQLQNPNIDSFVFDIEEEDTNKEHGILIYTKSDIRCYLTNLKKLESILDLGTELFVEQPFRAETLMTEDLQRKMTILQSDVDSLDDLNGLALSGNTPEPISEAMEIQQQKHNFCGLHSVVNMLITEDIALRNKFTIKAFTDASKNFITKNAEEQSLSNDLAKQFPRLLRHMNTLMLIPGEIAIQKMKFKMAESTIFRKYYKLIKDLRDYETQFQNSEKKKRAPTIGASSDKSITFQVKSALLTIRNNIVDIFNRVEKDGVEYFMQVLTFYKTQFSPESGGNYEIEIIKHAIHAYLCQKDPQYTVKLMDTLSHEKSPENINTRYIMGDGVHYIAVVPYTNSDDDDGIRFLRIDSRDGLEVKTYTSWTDLIKPYRNAIAVTYQQWKPLKQLHSSQQYNVNYIENGERRLLSITEQTSKTNDTYSDFKTYLQKHYHISTQSEWTNIIQQYESTNSNKSQQIQDWFENNAYDIMNKVWSV